MERPYVALHPVIDYRPYISASPDVFPPGHPGYNQGVATDLQIPTALQNQIERHTRSDRSRSSVRCGAFRGHDPVDRPDEQSQDREQEGD